MSTQLATILQEFAAQRRYREQKRNQYLRRFQAIKHHFHAASSHQHHHHQLVPNCQHQHIHREHSHAHQQHRHQHPIEPSHTHRNSSLPEHRENIVPHAHEHSHAAHDQRTEIRNERQQVPISSENELSAEQLALQKQNLELKQTLQTMQRESVQEINKFREAVQNAKEKYIKEIEKMTENSQKAKDQGAAKMAMLKEQTETALKKNKEIEQVNLNLSKELQGVNSQSKRYIEEIKKEYDEKIASFQAIFKASNDKIQALDQGFNEDEFIQNTLKNEELLKSIEQNASKAEEASKILQDYRALNQGKKEILVQRKQIKQVVNSNIAMKQKEIAKMAELEEKIKIIMEKLNAEKKMILTENSRMAKQLGEIKDLLMATVNEGK